MNLSEDIEIIYVDDGSNPAISCSVDIWRLKNLKVIETNDTRPWTQPKARNMGVKKSKGKYLMLVDLDHIVIKEVIDLLLETDIDLIRFKRYAGILDENGDLYNDKENLIKYGLRDSYMNRLENKGYRLPPHSNTFAIKRDLYLKIGGVSERYCGTGTYPNREEVPFKKIVNSMIENNEISYIGDDNRPPVYYFPNGKHVGDGENKDADPFGLFHGLKRGGRKTLFKSQREYVNTHERTFDNNPG